MNTRPADAEARIARHYAWDGLYARFLDLLAQRGVAPDAVTLADLRPLDHIHLGGADVVERLIDPLRPARGQRLLDIGCGVGGPARLMAGRYGVRVTGLDLSVELIDTATRLSALVGDDSRFVQGSALDMPFDANSFDIATQIYVGMNIPDKTRLFAQTARVLRPGGRYAIYDMMAFGGAPDFPVPWAASPDNSFLETPDAYIRAGRAAGLDLIARSDRGDAAQADLAARKAKGDPRPIAATPDASANMAAGIAAGRIAPVELIFEKPLPG